ncbi:MAG: ShlB/FhaC/HecB family hemolysin secretion/activation protein [Candidatus Omnitrophota bacterium]
MRNVLRVLFVSSIVISSCQSSHAQLDQAGVDRATRETDRSIREEEQEKLRHVPESKPVIEEEPEEEDAGPKFFIKNITVEGCESIDVSEIEPEINEYENKELSFNGLHRLSRKIQKEYLKRGIIATCVIPQQKIDTGEVIIKVIEGKMGVLSVQGNEYFLDSILAGYWDIPIGEILRYDKMVRSLELMNENPDRDVEAQLKAGEGIGTSDIVLVSNTRFPLHATASFDKEGAVSTGRERIGLGGRHNNFLLLDDTLISGVVFGKDFQTVYAYHSIPVSRRGTTLTYGFSQGKSSPKKEYTQYNINSRSDNWSGYLYQDLLSRGNHFVEGYAGMDFNDKVTKTVDGVFNKDRLRIVRFGLNVTTYVMGGSLYFQPEYSQGLNIFGASGKNNLSSRGASSNFSKFKINTRYIRPTPFNTKLLLVLKGQFSGEKLTPQEEMSLGGINSVRGYPSGDYFADNGIQTNVELLYPAFFIPEYIKMPFSSKPLKDQLTGNMFCDFGYGEKRGALPSEQRNATMFSLGLGARLKLYDQVYIRFAWGVPIGHKPITEMADSRIHFAVDFEENFLGMLVSKFKNKKTN